MKLKNSDCEETQNSNWDEPKNSNCDDSQKLKHYLLHTTYCTMQTTYYILHQTATQIVMKLKNPN